MPSPDEAMATMVKNLKEKTGKSLDEWVALARKSGARAHGKIVAALKSDHGLTHGYANLIAHTALQSAAAHLADLGADLVADQYKGPKASLRPIYDKLAQAISKFGEDVEFSPKKGYVSLRRAKQFAIIQPSTATRLDVGINLKGTPPTTRLEASGSFNAMVSHRVRVEKLEDVNPELIAWLHAAYNNA
jgi:hypothetical protein